MPTAEQLESIREAVRQAEEAIKNYEEELRLAEKAGTDVSARRQALQEQKTKVRMTKLAYGL